GPAPINVTEILELERIMKEDTSPPSTSTIFPHHTLKPEEFHIGKSGRPLTRVRNNTNCLCSTSVYNMDWCPYGLSKEECERDYLALPNDNDSVFVLSTDNCTLHFECSSYYSLYGNVYLPLGVFPEPSNLEKEITTAQRNGFSTSFECSQEGNFELAFVSSRRRVVFVIQDLACVRRFGVSNAKKTKKSKRKNKIPHPFSYPNVGFENA
ncbi:hypothetical protein PENTCL1PPCAC_28113, partial [Pristionchus entomophagus]